MDSHSISTLHTLRDSLIDLYVKLRIRKKEIAIFNQNQLKKEKEVLLHTNPINIVESIREKIDEMFKEEETTKQVHKFFQEKESGPPKDYEQMLQSLEEEIRNHISMEQQLKLAAEASQTEADEMNNENSNLKAKIHELEEQNAQISKESTQKSNLINELNSKLRECEERLNDYTQLENKNEKSTQKESNKISKSSIWKISRNQHNIDTIPRGSVEQNIPEKTRNSVMEKLKTMDLKFIHKMQVINNFAKSARSEVAQRARDRLSKIVTGGNELNKSARLLIRSQGAERKKGVNCSQNAESKEKKKKSSINLKNMKFRSKKSIK